MGRKANLHAAEHFERFQVYPDYKVASLQIHTMIKFQTDISEQHEIVIWLIDLIILHTSLIDYGKCVVNPIGGIDSFKRSILVCRLDCL
jgi:hypothetical protein